MHTLWKALTKPLGWRNTLYIGWGIYALHLLALAVIEFTYAVHPEQYRVAHWMLMTFVWFSLLQVIGYAHENLVKRYQKLTDSILKSWRESGDALVEMCKKLEKENTELRSRLSVYEKPNQA